MNFIKSLFRKWFGKSEAQDESFERPSPSVVEPSVQEKKPASLDEVLNSTPLGKIKSEVKSYSSLQDPFKKYREDIRKELKNLDPDAKKYPS